METPPPPNEEILKKGPNENEFVNPCSIKGKYNNEEIDIKIEANNNKIQISFKEKLNDYYIYLSLEDLIQKEIYFKIYVNLEEAYGEIIKLFQGNNYNIENIDNNLMLNLEIEYQKNKKILSFPFEKKGKKSEELINCLYDLTYQCLKENNKLKEDVSLLSKKMESLDNKVNSIEKKIDVITNYIDNLNDLESKKLLRKKVNNFNDILKVSNILDSAEQITSLSNWLSSFFKKEIKFKLIYDAGKDGDDASTFHSICDNRNNTLTIISTSNNKIIGGFLSKSYGGNSGEISDNNAFLFSLDNNEKYPSLNNGGNYMDMESEGPIFGYYSIYIKNRFLTSNNNYYCSFTKRYDFGKRSNKKNFLFRVVNLEIYQLIE